MPLVCLKTICPEEYLPENHKPDTSLKKISYRVTRVNREYLTFSQNFIYLFLCKKILLLQ